MKLKDLKSGDMFTKRNIAEPKEHQVWIKQAYDRSTKKYEIMRFDDICDVQLMDGNKEIFVDFTF